jgi:hypothetical protein
MIKVEENEWPNQQKGDQRRDFPVGWMNAKMCGRRTDQHKETQPPTISQITKKID